MNNAPEHDRVAVVVDPFSRRFGQTAEVHSHEKKYGILCLRFEDGTLGGAKDGSTPNDEPVMPDVVVFDCSDTEKIQALRNRLKDTRLRRKLTELCNTARRYFLPWEIRKKCPELFSSIVNNPFASSPTQEDPA